MGKKRRKLCRADGAKAKRRGLLWQETLSLGKQQATSDVEQMLTCDEDEDKDEVDSDHDSDSDNDSDSDGSGSSEEEMKGEGKDDRSRKRKRRKMLLLPQDQEAFISVLNEVAETRQLMQDIEIGHTNKNHESRWRRQYGKSSDPDSSKGRGMATLAQSKRDGRCLDQLTLSKR